MKRLFEFDLNDPKKTVTALGWWGAIWVALPFVILPVLIVAQRDAVWEAPAVTAALWIWAVGTWAVFTAPCFVTLWVAHALPAPVPLSQRSLLGASMMRVVRVFSGTLLLFAGGVVGGMTAQNLDVLQTMVDWTPRSPNGPSFTSGDIALFQAVVDFVFGWLYVAVLLAFTGAFFAALAIGVRVAQAGQAGRLAALRSRRGAKMVLGPRQELWRRYLSHGGWLAYFIGYMLVFSGMALAYTLLGLGAAQTFLKEWVSVLPH